MTVATFGRVDVTIPTNLGIEIKERVPLASYTTMKVGGPADYFATVTSTQQLLKLVRWARQIDLPYYLLGGGSNVLISDAGIRGLVIYNRCRQVRLDAAPCCQIVADNRPYLFAESGAAMAGVARQSIRMGVAGFEWAVSVPGTVGGAVVGNAGAHGGEVKDSLENALIIDDTGEVVEYSLTDFAYCYRDSSLKRMKLVQAAFKPVVLSANFRLPYCTITEQDAIVQETIVQNIDQDSAGLSQTQLKARADQFLQHRRQTQPVEPSLGSTFVNPPGDYAGRIIEEAGLKGLCIEGVVISEVHANFITNPGGVGAATASNVLQMVKHIQQVVERRMGIELIPEIQLVGEW